jgi:glycosyltransferase involved in cell wall biosynthesis
VGGATSHAIDEALFLKEGHEVLLITGLPSKEELDASYLLKGATGFGHTVIPGFYRTRMLWKHWATYKSVRKTLLAFKPDVVHTHTPVAGFIGRLAAASLGVKCIVHSYHGLLFTGYFPAWQSKILVVAERWLAKKSHYLLALSQSQKEALAHQYHIADPAKILCAPIGIDLAAFSIGETEKLEQRKNYRERVGFHTDDFVLGMVGRLVPIKNQEFAIKAFQKLLLKQPKAKLLMVGDGPAKRSLQGLCQMLGLSQTSLGDGHSASASVVFASWETNIPGAMAAMDVLMLTSKSEGTPLCIMEAMAAAKPVVCTAVGAIPEMVEHWQNGILVQPGDEQALVDALYQLGSDKDLSLSLGNNARVHALHAFDRTKGLQLIADLVDKHYGS